MVDNYERKVLALAKVLMKIIPSAAKTSEWASKEVVVETRCTTVTVNYSKVIRPKISLPC